MKRRRTASAVALAMDHGASDMLAKARAAHGRAAAEALSKAREEAIALARSGPDHGADGEAMLARPSRIIETIVAGVTARQTVDNHLIDRMTNASQLTGRQPEAAQRLLEMAGAAGILLGSSGGWSGGGRAEMSDDMAEAHHRWSRLMIWLGARRAELVMALMHERHPGVAHLATLQAALDMLGKRWGMEG